MFSPSQAAEIYFAGTFRRHFSTNFKSFSPPKICTKKLFFTARLCRGGGATLTLNFVKNYEAITLQGKFLHMFSCKQGQTIGSSIAKKMFWWNCFVIIANMITKEDVTRNSFVIILARMVFQKKTTPPANSVLHCWAVWFRASGLKTSATLCSENNPLELELPHDDLAPDSGWERIIKHAWLKPNQMPRMIVAIAGFGWTVGWVLEPSRI